MWNRSQVLRLLLWKPILERQVLMEREVVYSDAGHLEDGGLLMSQSPSPPGTGGGGFFWGRREQNKEIEGGGWKVLYLQMNPVHSDRNSGGRCVCVIPVQSSRLHIIRLSVILVPRLTLSKSPGAGRPEGWSSCLLKLVFGLLYKHVVYLQAARRSESALTETMSEEWWVVTTLRRCSFHC